MRKSMSCALVVGVVAAGALGLTACGSGSKPLARSGSDEIRLASSKLGASTSAVSRGLIVVGLTDDGVLVKFRTATPGRISKVGRVGGLVGDTSFVGIDYRVQNGKLYGVGDQGGIYTLSTGSAKATKVSQLTVQLSGTKFGVDFNPAANRLRVISDTGQNLRHNIDDPNGMPAAGTTATDGTLTIPPATTAVAGVVGAAYTNNDLDANTVTTLFDIDTMLEQVAIQSPANAGLLAPTGKLGVDATDAGFDIYSNLGKDGRTAGNTGYGTISVNGKAAFYQVGILAGKANYVGAFPSSRQVVDIALPLGQR